MSPHYKIFGNHCPFFRLLSFSSPSSPSSLVIYLKFLRFNQPSVYIDLFLSFLFSLSYITLFLHILLGTLSDFAPCWFNPPPVTG
jgi:hypothetical protein